ncbi:MULTISPECIES: sensor histidine kinase [Okeania]|uniref:histidine kinase n=1 Tax=Okeania hirsuta TaxID=1458930 RepID=A0A3N6PBB8_9CYAN|nr:MULTISPECIES: HAMP domain-containing sensor histidine kinase [Okeania]NES89192.1 HAMP domain-containing histidine kinase [Okeania sp. SIO2B9]RQH21737.1 sensor histidine kinase [Okeania hirsuta]RQH30662.1 sensor histidine kinase [Okeania hirsuta]
MFSRSRRNLACWFTWSMGGILIIFTQLLFYIELRDRLATFDGALYDRSRAIASMVEYNKSRGQSTPELENVLVLGKKSGIGSELLYVHWYNSQGQILQFVGEPPRTMVNPEPGFKTIANKSGVSARQLTLPVMKGEILLGYLRVATSLQSFVDLTMKLRVFLTVAVPLVWGAIGFAGWLLGGMAMQPIRKSYQAKSRFTADASHELRAPLAAILSNAQVGLLIPGTEETPQSQRLEKISTLAKSMSVLVNNLLILARHEGKINQEALQNVDLSLMLEELAEYYQNQAAGENLTFDYNSPQKMIEVKVEPELLRLVFENLLNNAFKYTPGGGKVKLKLETDSDYAIISITDTGDGIPATDLPHIFDRFYRVDIARTRKTGGFGLGLAITQQIVNAHNGDIRATSIIGKGSTFIVKIPLYFL